MEEKAGITRSFELKKLVCVLDGKRLECSAEGCSIVWIGVMCKLEWSVN